MAGGEGKREQGWFVPKRWLLGAGVLTIIGFIAAEGRVHTHINSSREEFVRIRTEDLKELRRQISALRTQVGELQTARAAQRQALTDLPNLGRDISTLRAEVSEFSREIAVGQRDLNAITSEIDSLGRSLRQIKNAVDALERYQDSTDREHEDLQCWIARTAKNLFDFRCELMDGDASGGGLTCQNPAKGPEFSLDIPLRSVPDGCFRLDS